MKRYTDKPPYSFHFYDKTQKILVTCPSCNSMGVIRQDETHFHFQCLHCNKRESREKQSYSYKVENLCDNCARFYRVEIHNKSLQNFRVLQVKCPHCGTKKSGPVQKTNNSYVYRYHTFSKGKDPVWGYPLFYCTSFSEQPLWAVNGEHLQYLIAYLSADLRQKPTYQNPRHPNYYYLKRTQADQLPTVFKRAKNRNAVVKLLKKLQQKPQRSL